MMPEPLTIRQTLGGTVVFIVLSLDSDPAAP
jgi:hypothetical protein